MGLVKTLVPRRAFFHALCAGVAGMAGTAAFAGCSALPQSSQVQSPVELILRYAENQPEDYPTTRAASAFAAAVEEKTGGRVKIKVYSGGELGNELSVIEQMFYGGIDFARVSLSQMAQYRSELNVLQLPYLYQDSAQMWRVLDGEIGDEFLADLSSLGLVGLSWYDAGVRSIYTREKVTSMEDLQGLTIRVQESDLMSKMMQLFGAQPSQQVYSQVYASLHSGEIDGAENNWPSYEAMAHYEVAPFVLRNEHTRVPEMQIASTAAFEKLAELDESYPEIVRQCALESAQTERTLWAERERSAEERLCAAGVEVTELSAAEKAAFRAAVAPIYEQFAAQAEQIACIQNA